MARVSTLSPGSWCDVRFWHKADIRAWQRKRGACDAHTLPFVILRLAAPVRGIAPHIDGNVGKRALLISAGYRISQPLADGFNSHARASAAAFRQVGFWLRRFGSGAPRFMVAIDRKAASFLLWPESGRHRGRLRGCHIFATASPHRCANQRRERQATLVLSQSPCRSSGSILPLGKCDSENAR
jgi:hypothetical protein